MSNDKTRIIGIGSPYGLDRFGWAVIDALNESTELLSGAQCITLDRPGAALVDYFEAKKVIIIDAIKSDGKIGELILLSEQDIGEQETPLSSHDVGLAQAINLAKSLNALPDKLTIIGVNIGEHDTPNIPPAWIDKAVNAVLSSIKK